MLSAKARAVALEGPVQGPGGPFQRRVSCDTLPCQCAVRAVSLDGYTGVNAGLALHWELLCSPCWGGLGCWPGVFSFPFRSSTEWTTDFQTGKSLKTIYKSRSIEKVVDVYIWYYSRNAGALLSTLIKIKKLQRLVFSSYNSPYR